MLLFDSLFSKINVILFNDRNNILFNIVFNNIRYEIPTYVYNNNNIILFYQSAILN